MGGDDEDAVVGVEGPQPVDAALRHFRVVGQAGPHPVEGYHRRRRRRRRRARAARVRVSVPREELAGAGVDYGAAAAAAAARVEPRPRPERRRAELVRERHQLRRPPLRRVVGDVAAHEDEPGRRDAGPGEPGQVVDGMLPASPSAIRTTTTHDDDDDDDDDDDKNNNVGLMVGMELTPGVSSR